MDNQTFIKITRTKARAPKLPQGQAPKREKAKDWTRTDKRAQWS